MLKGFVERVEQAHREIAAREIKLGLSSKDFLKTLREIRSSPLRQRAVAKKLGLRPDEIEEIGTGHRHRAKEDQEGRGRGQAGRGRSARDRGRDPARRAHGGQGQGEADRGQPATRGVDREEVHEPRPAVPGPHSGRQHRPHEGRRQVRLQAWLQVLHVRDVVDPPGHHARHRRSVAHDPHPRPHDRDDEQAGSHDPRRWCSSWDASRRPRRSRRRWSFPRTRSGRSSSSRRSRCPWIRRLARKRTRTSATSSRTRA